MNGIWIPDGPSSVTMPQAGWYPKIGTYGKAQVLAVHAALLPIGSAGKILYFGGSSWVYPSDWETEQNPESDPTAKAEIDHTRIYDCSTGEVSNPNSPDDDLFCCGHAFLPDGRLLIAGGTQHFPPPAEQVDLHHAHWSGSRATWIFDPHGLGSRASC